MFIIDSFLVFVLDKVRQVAEQQLDNPEALHQQLLEAQLQLEDGVIDAKEFARVERDVLARLRELRDTDTDMGGIADASQFDDIEVEVIDERS